MVVVTAMEAVGVGCVALATWTVVRKRRARVAEVAQKRSFETSSQPRRTRAALASSMWKCRRLTVASVTSWSMASVPATRTFFETYESTSRFSATIATWSRDRTIVDRASSARLTRFSSAFTFIIARDRIWSSSRIARRHPNMFRSVHASSVPPRKSRYRTSNDVPSGPRFVQFSDNSDEDEAFRPDDLLPVVLGAIDEESRFWFWVVLLLRREPINQPTT
mmetsp:Transcript_24544/g.79350  ORF Transcript_24544/g.79350 Transcript_24544/m.79350 type:complete len:221 (+) Transcript_24544:256-918(+)